MVNQSDSAFWSLHLDVYGISVLTRNGNGSYGTEERQLCNGTAQRNGNGRMATEWWKPGITVLDVRTRGILYHW